jgi:hypothetical protein
LSNLPERAERREIVLHPSLVRAAVSPAAVAATAVGAGIGVLDQSVVLGVVLAAVGWSGRMLAALVARARRDAKARPRPAELDPWSVPEPWRQLVHQAAAAQGRFDQALREWPDGPIRDRLDGLRPQFYADVAAVGAIAKKGAAMLGWTGAQPDTSRPTVDRLRQDLARVQTERQRLAAAPSGRELELTREEEAIAAQLRSLRLAESAGNQVHTQLRLIVARIDESVTSVLVLGTDAAAPRGPEAIAAALAALNDELTALHAGLDEARAPSDPLTP